ncbi:MAG: peptide chain release factor N(5)-glutamine methyltransferase [Syntrophomonadaceae bacterium]|nr:peptide chain release factor N(5)-glutamine methyltransferase [Syntrophomonadaceae bacterium]
MSRDWTVQDLLNWTKSRFAGLGIAEPRLEAEVLLAHALNLDRIGLYVQYDRPVNQEERASFREMIRRRVKGEPAAYITGHKEFMSLPFQVDRRVLIPRPDTEILVEESIRLLRGYKGEVRVLDVGTGCGAIAISIARYLPHALVYGVDISEAALEVAKANALLNGVADRVFFCQSDLLDSADFGTFHLIAANLPYIPSEKMKDLPPEVREYEPQQALDGGPDGLAVYRRLLPQAWRHLGVPGFLLLEVGDAGQAEELKRYAGEAWSGYYILKDLGQRDRVLVLKKGKHDADFTPQG